MRLVIPGHRQDRHLSNRALRPLQPPRSLIDGSKVGVHVARVASSSWDLFSSCRYLAQWFSVVGHVCENDEYVVSLLNREVLGGCESQSRGEYSLDRGVIRKVDKHGHVVERALLLEIVSEEAKLVCCDAHRGKYCREWFI